MIRVVNKHHYKGPGDEICRPSVMGNDWSHLANSRATHKVKTRQEAINCWEDWFDEQEENTPVKQEFQRLVRKYKEEGELTLICWCAPLSCHGHVLARKIEDAANGKVD
jgi:hypothetical protein